MAKEKSKKDNKSTKEESSKNDNNVDDVVVLDASHYNLWKIRFADWLYTNKQINIDEISEDRALELFTTKFIKKYNKRKLDASFYQPEIVPADDATDDAKLKKKEEKKLKKSLKRQRDESIDKIEHNDTTTEDQVLCHNTDKETKYYPPPVTTGDVTILLFYAYCPDGPMSRAEQDKAIAFCYQTLTSLGMTGRLRIAREGYNATLTGSTAATVRKFTDALKTFSFATFGHTDFKYVDGLPPNQMLKGLKVWPVTEIVTYGFDSKEAPLHNRGVHLSPVEFHNAMLDPNTVVIDVRNFNETVIGKFAPRVTATVTPPTEAEFANNAMKSSNEDDAEQDGSEKKKKHKKKKAKHQHEEESSGGGDGGVDSSIATCAKVLDPCMRRSTEFPQWVTDHRAELEGKKVLMYCTAGVRCEKASSYLKHQGFEDVYQLDGGIHRYLEAFPEDGGFWVGKNYTFDKRFNHGAAQSVTISQCCYCSLPWDRYQAQKKCGVCSMEVLLCKECQKIKPAIPRAKLFCDLCRKT